MGETKIELSTERSDPTMPPTYGADAAWRVRVRVRDYATLGLQMSGHNADKKTSEIAAMKLAYTVEHKLEELGFKERDRIERERLQAQLDEVRDCKEAMMEMMRATMTLDQINAHGWPAPFERIRDREHELVDALEDNPTTT